MPTYTIELFKSLWSRKWYFRVREENTQIVAQSQGYQNHSDCLDTAENLKYGIGRAVIKDPLA